MKFFCLGDADTVRGFRLAGVEGQVVASAPQAAAALTQAAAQPGLGVILLTEAIAASIREQVDRFRFERDRPLLVEIPGPAGPLPTRKRLGQLVQAAVGIQVGQPGGDA